MSGADPSSTASHEPSVFATHPVMLIEFFASMGVGRELLIERSGLDQTAFDDLDALVPYESVVRVWSTALDHHPDQPLGLGMYRPYEPNEVGVVGYAIKNSRDIRQAIELSGRFVRLFDPGSSIVLEDAGAQARVSLSHDPRLMAMQEPMEAAVADVALNLPRLCEGFPALVEVCLGHAPRHAIEAYRAVFGQATPLRFEAGWYGISFDAAALRLPVTGSDPQLAKYLQQRADSILEAQGLAPSEPLDARVREQIDQGLMSGRIDAPTIARGLGMSARTLQRRLGELGTSLSDQLEEVRRGRALQLLRQPELSAAEVAFMLGYGDPRSFYRSFRRWTGQNPTAFRRHD